MKAIAWIPVLLFALPALAAEAKPSVPASTPPATYEVWGYRWDGRQYVRQPAFSFRTADCKQAADYAAQIDACPGWLATTNLPGRTIYLPWFSIWIRSNASQNLESGAVESSPSYDASNAMQDMVNLQNMVSTQDMISTQEMLNTQQMNNNIQDMINTQNMVNNQNMIEAQNAANAQLNANP